ncbi:MAG: hypothetical protein GXP43_00660 [bacterium]|nr:hypothetical protein [bacterium]
MITFEVGAIGLILLLAAFTLVDTGRLDRKSWIYQLLNVIGALLLAIYAWELKAFIFVVLEAFWAAIALFELIFNRFKTR